MKASQYSVVNEETREEAMEAARTALKESKTIVMPTDTVYGIAADAFSPAAVTSLLAAKGRSRTMPPPVLIFDQAVLPGLADDISSGAIELAQAFWPGALTLILYSQPSLNWDLGETKGTVALRVPNDQDALELLRSYGPLAVSSANKTGRPAATSAEEAGQQLGGDVELILDGGSRPVRRQDGQLAEQALPSTIVDCTSERLVVVREGAITMDELRAVVPEIVTKKELEDLQREESERRFAESRSLAQTEQEQPASHGLGNGPRAAVAEPGSLNSTLVAGSVATGAIDQMRTNHAVRPQKVVVDSDGTKPLSVTDAYSLVHGVKDDTAAHAAEESHEIEASSEVAGARAEDSQETYTNHDALEDYQGRHIRQDKPQEAE